MLLRVQSSPRVNPLSQLFLVAPALPLTIFVCKYELLICVCVCVCVHARASVCVYMCEHACVCARAFLYVRVYVCIYVRALVWLCLCVCGGGGINDMFRYLQTLAYSKRYQNDHHYLFETV